MPSNKQQRLELDCRRNIHQVLTKALPNLGAMNYSDLVREAIINYTVGPRFVKNFVEEFYVEPGLVILKDGVLYPSTGVGEGGSKNG